MAIVAFDVKSHQAIRHLGLESSYYPKADKQYTWIGQRLSGLLSELSRYQFDSSFVDLEAKLPDDIKVLVISSRSNHIPFTNGELSSIQSLYEHGVGFFLMANHNGFVEPQNQIARCLFQHIVFNEQTIADSDQKYILNESHPITRNCQGGITIRTSCTMFVGDHSETIYLIKNRNPTLGALSVAIETVTEFPRRSVVITSSGHIASKDDSLRNMFLEKDNAKLTINSIRWLAGVL